MIEPISNNIAFRAYAPNFTSNKANKVINFQDIQKQDVQMSEEKHIGEEAFGIMKFAAISVQMCEEAANNRDKMAEEASEIFDGYRFGPLLDYADYMDYDSVDVYTHGEWQDVTFFAQDGSIKSKNYYKNGVLGRIEKVDKDGNKTAYDITQTKKGQTVTLDIKKRTFGNDNGYTALKLVIKEDKPYSYTDKQLSYAYGETNESYDKRVYFSSFDGSPIRYEEGFRLLNNGNLKIDKVLKKSSFQTRYIQYAEGDEKADTKLVFTPNESGRTGKLKSFTSGIKTDNDGFKTVNKRIVFDERGAAKTYQKNCILNNRGRCVSGSEFVLFEGEWLKVR